jgi:hypothetical protein
VLDLFQQIPGAVSVLNISGVDDDAEQEARGIDPDMAFAALCYSACNIGSSAILMTR